MPSDSDKPVFRDKRLEVLTRSCETAWTNFDRRRSYEWKLSLAIWTALTAFVALTLRGDVSSPAKLTFGLFAGLILSLWIFFLRRLKLANEPHQKAALCYETELNRAIGKPSHWDTVECAREKARKFWRGYWSFVVHIGITVVLIAAAGFTLYSNRNTAGERVMSDSIGVLNVLIPMIVAVIAFASALVTWCLNEKSKRSYEEYKRREDKYSGLIRSLRGFYVSSENTELKTEFLNQLNLCWMYCPDEVIRKAYNFLNMVHTGQKHSDHEKQRAVGELMLAIRKDLINRKPLRETSFRPEDFRHLKAT